MGPTGCKHQALMSVNITDNGMRCIACGALVPFSTYNSAYNGHSVSSSSVSHDSGSNNEKEFKKIEWSPPPGAPKKRKTFP
jgi:hypothetical protein